MTDAVAGRNTYFGGYLGNDAITGNASFELNIEQDRGMISMGGRLLDPSLL